MSITAYRLTSTRFVGTAFDGDGARLYGGRWNSIGTRVVYVSASRSLATLEILVHTEDVSTIEGRYSIIPITIPRPIIEDIAEADLPEGWASPQPMAQTQNYGDRWARENRSAALCVPSAITHEEKNYLLNPAHPDFPRIQIGPAEIFRLDTRLR